MIKGIFIVFNMVLLGAAVSLQAAMSLPPAMTASLSPASIYQFQLNAQEEVEFYSGEMMALIDSLEIQVSDCRDQRGVQLKGPAELLVKNSRSSKDTDLSALSVEGRFHFRDSVACSREAMVNELKFIFAQGALADYQSHRPMVREEVCGTFGGGCQWIERPANHTNHRIHFESLDDSDLPRGIEQTHLRLEFVVNHF